jgi:hypothetical protein
MKKFLKGLFTEDNGNFSMIRFLSFLCVIVALVMSLIITIKVYYQQAVIINNTLIPLDVAYIAPMTFLILGILGLAFGAKVSQKYGEKSAEISSGDKQP